MVGMNEMAAPPVTAGDHRRVVRDRSERMAFGIITPVKYECGSAAQTASRVVTERRRSGDVGSIQIPLTQGKYALIDEEDFDLVSRYKWSYSDTGNGKGYARANAVRENGMRCGLYMHRLLMGNPTGVVDHINHDELDNRRCNLRVVTKSENIANRRGAQRGSSSRFLGVSFDSAKNRWIAQVMRQKTTVYFETFADEISAAKARDSAARAIYGDHASLNFPEIERE